MSRSCLHCSRTVGSARLTFGDDRYYEFMCFDVPKVVRSPGYDHGHDEESRNGRYIKIDILEAYVWTSERFRVSLGIYQSNGGRGYRNPPGGIWALLGFSGKEGKGAREGAPPPSPIRIGKGVGPPFLSSLLPLPSLLVQLGKGESYSRRE